MVIVNKNHRLSTLQSQLAVEPPFSIRHLQRQSCMAHALENTTARDTAVLCGQTHQLRTSQAKNKLLSSWTPLLHGFSANPFILMTRPTQQWEMVSEATVAMVNDRLGWLGMLNWFRWSFWVTCLGWPSLVLSYWSPLTSVKTLPDHPPSH